MSKNVFFVDTSPKLFTRVLIREFQNIPVELNDDGQIWGLSVRHAKPGKSNSEGATKINFPVFQIHDKNTQIKIGHWLSQKPTTKATAIRRKLTFLGMVLFRLGVETQVGISFRLTPIRMPPNPYRIEVAAECSQNLDPIFSQLLKGIQTAFPEAKIKSDRQPPRPTAQKFKNSEIAERQNKVREYFEKGLTDKQMAQSLDVDESTIKRDRFVLGLRKNQGRKGA